MESQNRKNVKKNYIYNVIYQLFVLLTPLITTPYVSRVLGSAGIGQYSFTNSLITYFILLSSLGFGYYAQREIAKEQGDKTAQSKTFWEIFIARLGSVSISLLIYVLLLLNGAFGDYQQLMWILIVNIIASAFDITFLFQGNEQFGIIVLRNVIVKIIGIAAIFIFVQDQADVWVYVLCNSLILIGSNLSLWTRLPAVLSKVKCSELNVKRHIIPTLRLFIPTIAVSVYTILDKTLIGVLIPGTVTGVGEDGLEIIIKISDIENGYYEQSDKLVKMVMTVVTSLGTVMIPRNSQEIASGNIDRFKENIYSALQFVFFLGVPMTFG
ncbi:MAG: oligosaccharide flippase family protein, partial [Clostridia bacterium]|nr:oligosaccharide flippase family protein [Clostridia bacterium]